MHILLALLVIVAANYLALRGLGRLRRGRQAALSVLVSVDAVLAVLLVLELGMSLFFAQSDGFNITLASRNWFARYWKPVNSLGYRDAAVTPRAPGEKIVLVLGDSFAAGHGIERAEDRFGNRLGRELGPGWRVVNVAKNGWDTPDEIEALRTYPVKPDLVVLSYFVNDIGQAAARHGLILGMPVGAPDFFFGKYLVNHFSLVNFAYWRLVRVGLKDASASFWHKLSQAYADPTIWTAHAAEIESIVTWCRDNRVRLVALVIPLLLDVRGSAPITGKVATFLRDQGVAVVDLTGPLVGRKPEELVVNAVDGHANKALQEEMARLLQPVVLDAFQHEPAAAPGAAGN